MGQGGALASLFGLWRIAATDTSWWGRGVLGLQIVLVAARVRAFGAEEEP
jgi:hypothetical protein